MGEGTCLKSEAVELGPVRRVGEACEGVVVRVRRRFRF